MPRERRPVEHRFEEYWSWLAVALFLLITVDLLTTIYAAARYGTAAEWNPLVAWILGMPLSTVVAVNVAAVVLVVVIFYGLVELLRFMPGPFDRYFAWFVEAWLGVLVAAGLVVFANNLAVIVLGRSLL